MERQKIHLSWSGGKDCTLALYELLASGKYDVVGLHTTVSSETRRVGMHGIPEALIATQAKSLGIPWERIVLPPDTGNQTYEEVMFDFCRKQTSKGVRALAYGDIFLEDLKQYREGQLDRVGMDAVFPLWGKDTRELIRTFMHLGFKTLICCADDRFFGKQVLGRTIDNDFTASLPEEVDPCGENGEFHTFTYAGPLFGSPVAFKTGKKVFKQYRVSTTDGKEKQNGFWFLDLKPV